MKKFVDNFDKISKYLIDKLHKDEVISVEIMRRGKDCANIPNSKTRLIKSYYFSSVEQLLHLKGEISMLCKIFNARAYINLSIKNEKKVFERCALEIGRKIYLNEYSGGSTLYQSALDQTSSSTNLYLVDIDEDYIDKLDLIKSTLISSGKNHNCRPLGESFVVLENKTLSGIHLITTGFNINDFKKSWPQIDVHKHALTILYADIDTDYVKQF